MALEKTGNQPFDTVAHKLETRIQAGKPTSDVMVSDVLTALALRDDQVVSPKEQAVITHLKGSIPAVGTPSQPTPAQAPVAKKPAISSAKVTNFYTYFLNFQQTQEGQAFGEAAISKGKVPHLNKERSRQFAQLLGYQDAYALQRHVGTQADGIVGPLTIAKLNARNEAKADQILKAPSLQSLDALAQGDRRGFTESTFQAVLNHRRVQLKPAT